MLPLTFLLPVAAVFGLIIGSFINVVIHRVPSGSSLLTASVCPHCGAAIRPLHNVPVISWLALRGKCASCGGTISAQYPLIELATGAAFVLVFLWVGNPFANLAGGVDWAGVLLLALLWYFAAISLALTAIDIRHHRLPNAIVLPSYAVIGALLLALAAFSGSWGQLLGALLGLLVYGALFLLIALVYPKGMGLGDVKLAGVLGAVLGWFGWSQLIIGWLFAFLLGGLFGGVLLLFARAKKNTEIPFGPFMLAGAWVGLLLGEGIAGWYLNLL